MTRVWLAVRSHRSLGAIVAIGLAAGLAFVSSPATTAKTSGDGRRH